MVRIRLRRVGSRNQPSYRIVAADKESPRDGKFLEILGHYNPRTEPSTVVVDEERLFHWMSHGAQPSDAVLSALRSGGTWERWERYKGGESLETLLAEAEAGKIEVDPRTRRDDLTGKSKKKSKKKTEGEEPAEEAKEKEPPAKAEPDDAAEEPSDADADDEAQEEPSSEEEAEAEPSEEDEGEKADEAPAESEEAGTEPEETEQGEDAEAAASDDAADEVQEEDAEAEPDEDAKK
jgi:small subunit ribosomal protein S16